MIDALGQEIIKLLQNTMWPIYTKEHQDYTEFIAKEGKIHIFKLSNWSLSVFGFPDQVSDQHILVFYPTTEGLEKKTIPSSTSTTGEFFFRGKSFRLFIFCGTRLTVFPVKEALSVQCRNRGVYLSSFIAKDRFGKDLQMDIPLASVPGRIIVLSKSKFIG